MTYIGLDMHTRRVSNGNDMKLLYNTHNFLACITFVRLSCR